MEAKGYQLTVFADDSQISHDENVDKDVVLQELVALLQPLSLELVLNKCSSTQDGGEITFLGQIFSQSSTVSLAERMTAKIDKKMSQSFGRRPDHEPSEVSSLAFCGSPQGQLRTASRLRTQDSPRLPKTVLETNTVQYGLIVIVQMLQKIVLYFVCYKIIQCSDQYQQIQLLPLPMQLQQLENEQQMVEKYQKNIKQGVLELKLDRQLENIEFMQNLDISKLILYFCSKVVPKLNNDTIKEDASLNFILLYVFCNQCQNLEMNRFFQLKIQQQTVSEVSSIQVLTQITTTAQFLINNYLPVFSELYLMLFLKIRI
ncbi:Reverse_transcriptase/endonuclease [Hexamita inflata]|uniref:Reverse transcriptase/endonuclease n=1 Tax=Hexamita inflata TaxID=28002 RepID=A0AA86TJP3_9EUKA|nr:Reverse transcriptase/endonuclease [Hexamita inflata]